MLRNAVLSTIAFGFLLGAGITILSAQEDDTKDLLTQCQEAWAKSSAELSCYAPPGRNSKAVSVQDSDNCKITANCQTGNRHRPGEVWGAVFVGSVSDVAKLCNNKGTLTTTCD